MKTIPLNRRDFIKAGAATGAVLSIGFTLPGCAPREEAGAPGASMAPNAFVRITGDGTVTVISKHLEMGQGSYTGLATLVADELDADWGKIRVEGAPADVSRYNNLAFGAFQGTGGSSSMANSWEQFRKAGATARAMLVAAAAAKWGADPSSLKTENGIVTDPASGKRASFGSLVAAAAALPVPAEVRLKEPREFRLIGKVTPRVDARAKVTGRATFTQDVVLPGMLTAVVAHPPRFGAVVRSFEAAGARQVAGVKQVVQIPTGVAVLAEGFWAARQGREALKIEWDESAALRKSSDELFSEYRALASRKGAVARTEGDASAAISRGQAVEAVYEFPYLAHAAMEPLNCVVRLSSDKCEIWNGEQFQSPDQMNVAGAAGLKPEQVELNMLFAGGSFGRRANPHGDYLLEAVSIAKAIDGAAPVKLVWTREDDMRAGYYRPMYVHRVAAAVDGSGGLSGWRHTVVGQSIMKGGLFEGMIQNGIDPTSVEGVADMVYPVPNLRVELHTTDLQVPVLWWRSVGHTHTAFVMETMIDELAARAGRDPVEFRRAHLSRSPRHLAALELAAEKAGWGTPLPAGRARGVAVHESFNSVVAEVAEVSLEGGRPRVHRVTCAVDCGIAINPDIVTMQMESGIGFALAAALTGEITLTDGMVDQGNFDRYKVLRIDQMPKVEVHIVPSDAAPTGVGEPGVPPLAPAVANAMFQLTGKRVRKLPLG
jgi:isoquinoline 1-oxidoreductase beta subunit